jgi:nucleoside-diphosphate-sugar epimerase
VKVVVTGASGFVGHALLAALPRAGHEAVALDLRKARFAGGDVIVHLAAIAHRGASPEEFERVNVKLAKQVAQDAAARGVGLVFLSSVKVHGEVSGAPFTERSAIAPRDSYAASKARAEEALAAIEGLRLAVLRPPLVYGPRVKANFLRLTQAIEGGIPLPFASIRNRRSLVYVGNLVEAVLQCLGREGTYLVSDGSPLSTPELCRALGDALGRRARLWPFPSALLPRKIAASLEVDDRALRDALGWRPSFSVGEGLLATARWYLGR